jgi:hypothetical protein
LINLFAIHVLLDLAKLILTAMHGLNLKNFHPNARKHSVTYKLEAAVQERKKIVLKNAEQVACHIMHVIVHNVY